MQEAPRTRPRHLALRVTLATAAVLAIAHFCSHDLVALMLPTLTQALSFVADDFRILSVGFAHDRGNASIAALALLDHTVVLGGRAVVPDGRSVIAVGTTIGTVLQPALVALVLVLAWPAQGIEMVARVAVACVLIGVVLLVDTPLSMAAWLWDVQLRTHEPGRASPLVWWNVFLNGGGRLALGLIAAAVSIGLAQRVSAPCAPQQHEATAAAANESARR